MFKQLFDVTCPNILIYDKLESTSLEAKRIIQSGYADHGLIIWAKEQLNGYGRYDRTWESASGNLTFSFVIENERDLSSMAIYPFVAALAIREALQKFCTQQQFESVSFKWPNDILFDGKKFAGVIFESEIQDNRVDNLICGIGINVASFPNGFNYATSLHDIGVDKIGVDELMFSIIMSFDELFKLVDDKGDQVIYDQWLKVAYNLDREIIVASDADEIKGIFTGIRDGNLVVKERDGAEQIISTGNVFFSEKEKITAIFDNVETSNVTFLKRNKKLL